MKRNISEYLLCKDPMKSNSEIFIWHTRTPEFMCRVLVLELDDALNYKPYYNNVFLCFPFKFSDGSKEVILELYKNDENLDPDEIMNELNKAKAWFKLYLEVKKHCESSEI